jgi:nucleotide-binding universal stress UspA family protein
MPGIVVGVDGSPNSHRALEWAAQEAAVRQVPLTVLTVHVVPATIWGHNPERYPQDADLEQKAQAKVQELADQTIAALTGAKPESVTVRSISGTPAEELINASSGADLVVVGSRGHGGFAELLMGSVSSQVTHHAHCPVVIVPEAGA